jgi:AraC-like DNA-binding protein
MSTPDPGSAPVQRFHYATEDADEATELLRALYADHRPSFSGSSGGCRFELSSDVVSTSSGALSVDHLRHTARVSALVEPPRAVVVVVPVVATRLCYTCGREEAGAGPRLCPPWSPFHSEWEDVDIAIGTLDQDGLRRVGAEVSGLDPSAVAFTGMNPISPALGAFVAATLERLRRDLFANEEVMAGPIVRGQAFRELAAALLVAFPNTTHTLDAPRTRVRAEPATIRRAVEFIDANAHRDIGLTDIADAARLGVRGLQMAFRRHRDTTPLAYLKKVRMEWAHRDLQLGDPRRGDTVVAIAARWGFTHAGAFSTDYRQVYGCPPSHTLRG